jgi:hypothetical protein
MTSNHFCFFVQHPTLLTGKRPDLMKEACSIMWHVAWEDLMTLEVLHSKHDPPGAPHSRVVLHLRTWSQDARLFDTKEIARVVKCHPGTTEAAKIRAAIQNAYDTYGPDRAAIAELVSIIVTRILQSHGLHEVNVCGSCFCLSCTASFCNM